MTLPTKTRGRQIKEECSSRFEELEIERKKDVVPDGFSPSFVLLPAEEKFTGCLLPFDIEARILR